MNKKYIAIVTGASSGIGREFLKLILKDSDICEIWAIARNKDRLELLKVKHGEKIHPLPIDLTDRKNYDIIKTMLFDAAANTNSNEKFTIKYLINCAGFAKFCSYDDISLDESLNMIDLNICALTAMGLLCLPYMERGCHIINMSSQAAFQPLPYQNIYSSTKAYVRNYTRALNTELKKRGITATAVCPGWMITGLYERALIGANPATNCFPGIVSPDVVAKKALRDAKNGKDISIYSLYVKAAHITAKFLPQKIMIKIWLKQQKIE